MEYVASRPSRKKIIVAATTLGCALVIAGVGLTFFLGKHRTASLLPKQLANQVQFTPYFYFDTIPAGYTIGAAQAKGEVIMISLVKNGRPAIVLTEQSLPENLDASSLQKDGNRVKGAEAPATVSQVTGRLVGTMIDKKNNVLVLLNTTNNSDENDLSSLLSNLRLIR